MIRLADKNEVDNWDEYLVKNPDGGHLQQTKAWAESKRVQGKEPMFCVFEHNDLLVYFLLIKSKSKIIGNTYKCPRGPGLYSYVGKENDIDKDIFESFSKQIKDFLLKNDPAAPLLIIDPRLRVGQLEMKDYGFSASASDGDYNATIYIDLPDASEKVLPAMKSKTRYKVNYATKQGISVERVDATKENMQKMYNLMTSVSGRADYFLRKEDGLFSYWSDLSDSSSSAKGALFFAHYNEELLAAAFISLVGEHASYKDGASKDAHRSKRPTYLLQLEAMRWAVENGAKDYDMCNTPPSTQLNKNHPYFGMYSFKKSFGDNVTDFVATQQMTLNSSRYVRYSKLFRFYNSIYIRFTKNTYY